MAVCKTCGRNYYVCHDDSPLDWEYTFCSRDCLEKYLQTAIITVNCALSKLTIDDLQVINNFINNAGEDFFLDLVGEKLKC